MEQNIRCVFYYEDSSNIQRFVYTVKPLNKEHLVDTRTKRFVYTVKPLNKKHLGDARAKRFVYTVKALNKEHLGDVMTLIMTA